MGNSHLVSDFSFIVSPFLYVFGGTSVIFVVCGLAFLARATTVELNNASLIERQSVQRYGAGWKA